MKTVTARSHIASLWLPLVLAGLSLSLPSAAQGPGLEELAKRKITLKADGDIRKTLQALFSQARVPYVLDQSIYSVPATFGVTDMPFGDALQFVIGHAPFALSYKIENGVFIVRQDTVICYGPELPFFLKIPGSYLKAPASLIARRLKTLSSRQEIADFQYKANPDDNSLLLHYKDPDKLPAFRELIRQVDVLPQQVEIEAKIILVLPGVGKQKQQRMLRLSGRTYSEQAMKLRTKTEGQSAASMPLRVNACEISLTPIVNGDEMISLEAYGSFDLSCFLPGENRPIRLTQTLRGAGRATSGRTVRVFQAALPLHSAKTGETEARLEVYLTPRRIDRKKADPTGPGGSNPGLNP